MPARRKGNPLILKSFHLESQDPGCRKKKKNGHENAFSSFLLNWLRFSHHYASRLLIILFVKEAGEFQ